MSEITNPIKGYPTRTGWLDPDGVTWHMASEQYPLPVAQISGAAVNARTQAFDNSGTNNATIYVGSAPVGTTQATAAWTIYAIGYDANGVANSITWGSVANGQVATNLVWNNRASYTYS